MEFLVEGLNPLILGGTPKAKATFWYISDANARKHGEQMGLETPVVHAVNDEGLVLVF